MTVLGYRHVMRWLACCMTLVVCACSPAPVQPRSGANYTAPIIEANGMMYVEVQINGQGPFLLNFDTGAALTIDAKWAEKLGLPSGKSIRFLGLSFGDDTAVLSRADSIVLAGLGLGDMEAALYPFKPDAHFRPIAGVPVIGFIGNDLLRRYPVTVDQQQMQLTLHDDGKPLFACDERT